MEHEKKYWVDVYYYQCPTCKKVSIGKTYFYIYQRPEIGQAKMNGLLKYKCIHCGTVHPSNRVRTNGEVVETSAEEALANGIDWESKGSA
jgi:hypothetical protein